MDKKEKELAAQNNEEQKTPTNKERFNSYMSGRIKDYNTEDEEGMYGQLINDYEQRDAEKQKLTDAMVNDPRIAQLIADVASGKRGAAGALARYFGKDFLSAEEGTPEYEEIMAAEEERKKDAEAAAESSRKYKENMEASIPVIEDYCKEKGISVDEFMNHAWESVVSPIMQGIYTREICEILDKGFSYDNDVEDAMKAGEVKGRNTNINKMRSSQKSDGMPSGLGSGKPIRSRRQDDSNDILKLASKA